MAQMQMQLSSDEEALIQQPDAAQPRSGKWRPVLLASACAAALGLVVLYSGSMQPQASTMQDVIAEVSLDCVKCDVKTDAKGGCAGAKGAWLTCPAAQPFFIASAGKCASQCPAPVAPAPVASVASVPQDFKCIKCDVKITTNGACTLPNGAWHTCSAAKPYYSTKVSTCTDNCFGPAPVPQGNLPSAPAAPSIPGSLTPLRPSPGSCLILTDGTCPSTGMLSSISNMFSSTPTCGKLSFKDATCSKEGKCGCKAGMCYDKAMKTCK